MPWGTSENYWRRQKTNRNRKLEHTQNNLRVEWSQSLGARAKK